MSGLTLDVSGKMQLPAICHHGARSVILQRHNTVQKLYGILLSLTVQYGVQYGVNPEVTLELADWPGIGKIVSSGHPTHMQGPKQQLK